MKSFYKASLIALGADQVSKILIRSLVSEGAGAAYLSPWLTIIHCSNTGAAFGLLQGRARLLIPFTILAVVIIVYMTFNYRHLALPLAFTSSRNFRLIREAGTKSCPRYSYGLQRSSRIRQCLRQHHRLA
jgi:hypothetical protein